GYGWFWRDAGRPWQRTYYTPRAGPALATTRLRFREARTGPRSSGSGREAAAPGGRGPDRPGALAARAAACTLVWRRPRGGPAAVGPGPCRWPRAHPRRVPGLPDCLPAGPRSARQEHALQEPAVPGGVPGSGDARGRRARAAARAEAAAVPRVGRGRRHRAHP